MAMVNFYRDEIKQLPTLGLGLGLRNKHFDYITSQWPEVDWFEAISENFMDSGGRPRHILKQVAERYPIVLHGVSMSIGSTDPLDFKYLAKLKTLAKEVNPKWVSDHLCWTGVMGLNTHDLLPLPLNEETLGHVAARVKVVQDYLERPLVLENPSTYMSFQDTTIAEPVFLRQLADETGCGLLLDVNNVYVTCFNAEADPEEYLKVFPFDRVVQMHLAGHQHCGTHIIDTHDRPVLPKVWELFQIAWQRTGGTSTLLEWDGNIPDFPTCHEEVLKAKRYMGERLGASETGQDEASAGVSLPSNPVGFMIGDVMNNTKLEVGNG